MAHSATYHNEKLPIKTVWYTGSDTLTAGYALCYDRDTITAQSVPGTNLAATSSSFGRHLWAEKPASGNLHNFAGIVIETPNKAGPCYVKIVEPGPLPRSMTIYTDVATVLDTTVLTLVDGSYGLGAIGSGLVIGHALQATAGSAKCQALIKAVDIFKLPYGIATPSSSVNSFSAGIWESCPIGMPEKLVYFFDDYAEGAYSNEADATAIDTGTSTTECYQWIQTEQTTGLTAKVEDVGGVLRVSSEAATADQGLTVMYRNTPFVPATGKRIWFEARIKLIITAAAPDTYYCGLANTQALIIDDGVVDDTVDKIGFFRQAATAVNKMGFITATTTTEEITAAAATVAAATWINVGFVADLASVTPYANNVAGTAHETNLPTLGMGICLGAYSEGTQIGLLDVDWIRVAQLR